MHRSFHRYLLRTCEACRWCAKSASPAVSQHLAASRIKAALFQPSFQFDIQSHHVHFPDYHHRYRGSRNCEPRSTCAAFWRCDVRTKCLYRLPGFRGRERWFCAPQRPHWLRQVVLGPPNSIHMRNSHSLQTVTLTSTSSSRLNTSSCSAREAASSRLVFLFSTPGWCITEHESAVSYSSRRRRLFRWIPWRGPRRLHHVRDLLRVSQLISKYITRH